VRRASVSARRRSSWLTSLQPDYFLSYRLLPRSASETLVTADIYFHASAFVDGFDPSDVVTFWARTNAEDRAICERQQRGMAAPSFEPGPYASVEDGVFAFDRKLISEYRLLYQDGVAR
jgi:Rieske 2Fe-2S family protein